MAQRSRRRRVATILAWMAIGAGQVAIHGGAALAFAAFRVPGVAVNLDRASRGLGKVFWWVGLDFYGSAGLARERRARAAANAGRA